LKKGTQTQWLHDLLTPVSDCVVVCDRRGESQQGNKGDRIDSDELSERLRRGDLRSVYHGSPHVADLKELARAYQNVVEDTTRVMLRLKALFRARAIRASGRRLYNPAHRAEWLAKLSHRGARFRAEALYTELIMLLQLRPKVKAAMVAEARRDPSWASLRTIPFLGPVASRCSWPPSDPVAFPDQKEPVELRRARRKDLYQLRVRHRPRAAGAAPARADDPRARQQPQPRREEHLQECCGIRLRTAGSTPGLLSGHAGPRAGPGLARATLARKLAALTLRLWKKGEPFDPELLTVQVR
jgi:hypothetical protein